MFMPVTCQQETHKNYGHDISYIYQIKYQLFQNGKTKPSVVHFKKQQPTT